MINNKERWVYFYDYKFTPYPKGSNNIPLKDLLSGLETLVDNNEAVKFYNHMTSALRITSMDVTDEKTITLLIQLADKNISDPAFSDIEKGNLRVVEKAIGEGVAITAHIIISCEPYMNRNIYLVTIEKVPGINSARIASFLTAIFKIIRNNENIRVKDEKGKNRIHFPQITASGHTSESLKSDLEHGTLRGFEFISYDTSENDGFDEETYLKPRERSLKIGVSRFESGEAAWKIIKSAANVFNKNNYDRMRVNVRKEESDRWVEADVNDLESTAFVRHEKISLENEIKSQCLSDINNEVKEAINILMLTELESE